MSVFLSEDQMQEKKIGWYRTPIDISVLQELTKKSDLKGFLQAGSFLLVFLITTSIAVWFFLQKMWIPMIAMCYIHSMFLGFVSMAAAVHELSHGTVFKNKKINDFFYNLFCFLTWNNPVHFRASHTYHHQFTVHRGVDLEVIQGPVKEKLNFTNLFLWFTFDIPHFLKFIRLAVLHAFGRGDEDYFFWKPLFEKDDPRRKQMIRFARIMLIAHIVLIIIFVYFQLWVLIYLITFGSFFATFLSKLCGALQHTGLSESIPDWRVVCYTAGFNPLLSYLYWNMNYHIEHHMFAAVPFHNLKKLHELVKYDYPLPQKSFLSGLRLLFRIKKEQKKDPGYIYKPEFPETANPVKWE
jgi:fatty acid desaturase